MAPSEWDEEEPTIAHRNKFDDEEEDSDVLESWDAAEDSEVEREKTKKAAEAKAKADAEAKANHKSKSQRIAERREENMRRRQAGEAESSEEEDEAERRARLRKTEQDADLKHAEDLFGGAGGSVKRTTAKPVTLVDDANPDAVIDLSALKIFDPTSKDQFTQLRETLVPLLAANTKKAQYTLFLQEFTKQIAKDLPSDQIKKIASGLTTLSNEKMKEEKAAEKGGKKTKAAKTKASLVATRDVSYKADTAAYDDDFGECVYPTIPT
ncbi:translation initiation factor eIF3 subunit [Massarina eburnea CBS 473.64]|uniref:Eukaryotic translation initiation factor 3 subunit J n=1 Tax=Massarina eburnea CBS 473.64 TaxID=1395130 RepID=A0A6A6S9D3_9PLEO|nr:translation initiation factor eIF3 subunit [Massarina eburnea CBS 473.64]